METRKSDDITAMPTRKDTNTSDRPSDQKQGRGKKSKINENYYAVFGRMADRTGEAQDTVDKTKNLGVEMNTERKKTGRTSIRKGEGDKLGTGKTIKTWEEGKMEEKKDGTERRPQNKRSGESTPKEDCMEVERITNDNSNTKEAEHKTPVKDRTDQGKTAR
jgi:hypothetical protein